MPSTDACIEGDEECSNGIDDDCDGSIEEYIAMNNEVTIGTYSIHGDHNLSCTRSGLSGVHLSHTETVGIDTSVVVSSIQDNVVVTDQIFIRDFGINITSSSNLVADDHGSTFLLFLGRDSTIDTNEVYYLKLSESLSTESGLVEVSDSTDEYQSYPPTIMLSNESLYIIWLSSHLVTLETRINVSEYSQSESSETRRTDFVHPTLSGVEIIDSVMLDANIYTCWTNYEETSAYLFIGRINTIDMSFAINQIETEIGISEHCQIESSGDHLIALISNDVGLEAVRVDDEGDLDIIWSRVLSEFNNPRYVNLLWQGSVFFVIGVQTISDLAYELVVGTSYLGTDADSISISAIPMESSLINTEICYDGHHFRAMWNTVENNDILTALLSCE